MKLLTTVAWLLSTFSAWSQSRVYELTDQDTLEFQLNTEAITYRFDLRQETRIASLYINGCTTSPCPVFPDSDNFFLVTTVQTERCRLDVPELSWQFLWTWSGSGQISYPEIDQAVTITVTCENNQYDQVSQTIETEVIPAVCNTTPTPPGLSMVYDQYVNYNDGFDFGTSTDATFDATVGVDEYMVLDSISMQDNTRRRLVFTSPPDQRLLDVSTISVSRCRGDFTEQAACVMQVNNNLNLFFSTRPTDASSPLDFCVLEPNTDYYINYIHSPDPFTIAPSCADGLSSCTFFYREAILN